MVPGAESNIERKQLIHNASLNEISAWANNEANAISALKNRGSIPVAKPALHLGSENGQPKARYHPHGLHFPGIYLLD